MKKIQYCPKTTIFIFCFVCVGLFLASVICARGEESPAKFIYQQKPIGEITEKNVKIRVAVSQFDEKLQIEGSPYNIKQEPDDADRRGINIRIEGLVNKTQNKKRPSKAELLTGLLTDKLRKTGMFDVVERREVNELIREINFEETNWVKQEDVNKLGNIHSVQYIVTGDILENRRGHKIAQTQYTLALRIYNVNTGEVMASSTSRQDYLEAAVDEAVRIMANEVKGRPWTCRVVRIEDGEIYINAGDVDDIKKDDVFAVFRIAGEIKDPATEKVLGFDKVKVAKIKVREVLDENLSRAVLIDEYRKIQVGDIVAAKKIDIMGTDDEIIKWNKIFGRPRQK